MADPAQILNLQFISLGISYTDTLDEVARLSSPPTSIRRPKNASHWSTTNNIFEQATEEGVIKAKPDDYNYKHDFRIWKENQEFERQTFSRSRPPLE